jgi:RNA polymerase sigma-70 factor (ECF subfamily)
MRATRRQPNTGAQETIVMVWKRPGEMAMERRGPVADADWAAIQRCLAGDREAFAEVVERHRDLVHNLAYRLVSDPERAADLAQEAFLRAYAQLGKFRGESPFRVWLCRIAVRLCIDHLRTARPPALPLAEDLVAADSGEWTERLEMRRAVEQAIASLPPMYRAAIVLRHVHELSYREIARALDLNLSTVKTHIRRARLLMRQRLAPLFGAEESDRDG